MIIYQKKIHPFIQSLPKEKYSVSEPQGNVITAENIYDTTEQTWNFSILKLPENITV